MKKSKQKSKVSLRLNPDFFISLMVAIGVILVWRGIWDLADLYLLPHKRLLSDLIGILIGLFLLYLPDKKIDKLI